MKDSKWESRAASASALAGDARWDLAQRVASSETFANCSRLSGFLLHVCELTLAGEEARINEQQIGVHAFGRPAGYSSAEDSIVRSQARLLRAKLDLYFATEGKNETVRIVIPKGSYIPRFPANLAPSLALEPPAPAPSPAIDFVAPQRIRRNWALPAAIFALAASIAFATLANRPARVESTLAREFWTQMFDPARSTMIVPCDTALVTLESTTHRDVGLTQYINRAYEAADGRYVAPSAHRYTAMPDLIFTSLLFRLPESQPGRTLIRFSRDLQMADLRASNVILIGARRSNPWVELFDKNDNFQGLHTEERGDYILNRAPQSGESDAYVQGSDGNTSIAYAIVSFVPGVTGEENVLMVGGTVTPGTEGAANFLFGRSFEGFLAKAEDSRRKRIRHFEILLRVRSIGGSAQQPEILAYRIHPE